MLYNSHDSDYDDEEIIIHKGTKEEAFTKTFNLPFDRLKIQNENIRTNDGCIHYMDIQTNEIYSYEFFSNRWLKHQLQANLKHLFN